MAIAPLSSYISGLLASFPMRTINKVLGRKTTIVVGLFFVLASTALFWFLVELKNDNYVAIALVSACILLGIGTSTTNICSFSLTSDLIGLNTECGAFVYGIMSFSDKLANGIVIAVIQQFNPCISGSTTIRCASYYRYILTFIPICVTSLTILMTLSMWKTNVGANRHEAIPDQINDTTVNNDAENDERQPLIA